jgi:glutamate dehydrogenase
MSRQTSAAKAPKQASAAKTDFSSIFLRGANNGTQPLDDALSAIAARHEILCKAHKPGRFSVEIYNPVKKTNGWSGTRTVIDIVSDDMAFLIDSVTSLLTENSFLIEKILHPHIFVRRGDKGQVDDIRGERQPGYQDQLHMFIELNRRLTDQQIKNLQNDLLEVLEDVRYGTRDWLTMKAKVKAVQDGLKNAPAVPPAEMQEYFEFLDYVHDDNFTLLGSLSYKVSGSGASVRYAPVKGSGLGLLSEDRKKSFFGDKDVEFIQNHKVKAGLPPLFTTKLSRKSSVHRRVPLDVIVVRQYDGAGALVAETLFIGLFTAVSYSRSVRTIPLLRYKAEEVIRLSGFEENSHGDRALRYIIEKYPRDELFQIDTQQLSVACMGILRLQEKPRIALYTRQDPFGRGVSCLVYIPRDRFDSRVRMKLSQILEEELGAKCETFYSTVDDSLLVRSLFIMDWKQAAPRAINVARIEEKLQEAGRSWAERLSDATIVKSGKEDLAAEYAHKYGRAFPVAYQEQYSARQAVHDVEKLEDVLSSGNIRLELYKPYNAGDHELSLKVFSPGMPIALSDILPVMENAGLRVIAEYPFEVKPEGSAAPIWIQDFVMSLAGTTKGPFDKLDIMRVKDQFESCLYGIWQGDIENDGLNRLILLADMKWRDVVILRTYIRYMRQTKIPFGLPYMEQALTDHPGIARILVDMFHERFSPALRKKSGMAALRADLQAALEAVSAIDQDRILRSMAALVDATLRTNFYQADKDGAPKPYLSIKLDSSKVPDLPDPRPYREIFVYSPRVEGIHLRGDRIARGGLRWSDRHEDFRVEILGLMKAQQVKNSLIVPMGAKGGFVVKRPPKTGGPAAAKAEGISCYQTFIRGLLDITDNQKGSKILPPENVVRHDDDDPYLVVAADKGTATFSDIANALSLEYGFWLGDAFASGGSAGYDHKQMGITARGAWESVKRHFRELNHDTQTKLFDVVGVGDMGGDVFGNGLLQSKKIRLVGAFNHVHIFCDPDPDAESSFKERARLFAAVKGWDSYDTKKLSKGGRIYNRSDKALQLTPEIQKRFDLAKSTVSPSELIQAMLRARTDLLFFGGIGTYIKATQENNAEAGDRSNDGLRVNAGEIRAKVIGEGANLGMTQRARIEFSLKGGRLNTDFVDNSAGVDTSDHEVNIKILLADAEHKPQHRMTDKARDRLLKSMTDEIAGLVLSDNYQQTQALSLMEMQAAETLSEHASFMSSLEKAGLLSRAVEFLPDDDQIEQRRKVGKGLTRPELCLILSYGKITYTQALLETDIPDSSAMTDWAVRYFPTALQKNFRKEIENHRLRREIVATALSNSINNRMGPTFIRLTMEKTGADCKAVTQAFLTARDVFGLSPLWHEVEAQDNKVPALVQLRALRKIARMAERETYWFLTQATRSASRTEKTSDFESGVETLRKGIKKILPQSMLDHLDSRVRMWKQDGMPDDLAQRLALLPILGMGPDIIHIAKASKTDLMVTARVFFAIGSLFRLDWLRTHVQNLPADTRWSEAATEGLMDQFYALQSALTLRILNDLGKARTQENALDRWIAEHCPQARHSLALIEDLVQTGSPDLAMLMVTEQSLGKLV